MTLTNTADEQRWKAVRAHIAKGDKAKAKADDPGSWAEWEALVKEKAGIGKSRASELMAIAAGTKTVEQVRAETSERTAKTRALQSSPLRSGEDDDEASASRDDIGATSAGEAARKDARIDELYAEKRQLEIKVHALEDEVEHLKAENAELRRQLEATNGQKKTDTTAPKKRGRPKGSKNKPKAPVEMAEPILGNDPGPIPEFLQRAS